MKPADESILRLLSETGISLTAGNIAYNTGFGPQWVRERLKELEDRGLVDVDRESGNPYYQATDLCDQFIAGELSADDLESL